ncbi:MAG: type II secretion system protein GspG [Luteolibacter sp.]
MNSEPQENQNAPVIPDQVVPVRSDQVVHAPVFYEVPQHQIQPAPPQTIIVQQQQPNGVVGESNDLGTAGFVLSILGLFSCGLTSIFGLIFSLCALHKKPRGLANAGSIIGALPFIPIFMIGLNPLISFCTGLLDFGKSASEGTSSVSEFFGDSKKETQTDAALKDAIIRIEKRKVGGKSLDATIAQYLINGMKDAWGNQIVYEAYSSGAGFSVRSLGKDGIKDTSDDRTFSLGEYQAKQALDAVKKVVK